jgi:excinuclease ABC subunit C
VRDEAHRTALRYQRQKRTTRMTASALDDIPGLGPARRKALLARFGSVKRIRRASVAELASVPGFGTSLAERVLAALLDPAAEPTAPAVNLTTGEVMGDDEAVTEDPAS